ncbi:MAG TPA: hypothetical protein VFV05_05875 [Methylomirabilota bacterium]|nr:hypothetical protein [Methylomirabilota bacterium]
MGFGDHDFILASVARHTLERAQAEAARHRLVIEALRPREEAAMLGLVRVPAGDRVTGFVALVIQPDAATIRASWDLAASLLPSGAEQVLGPGSLPHVTLTQCALREAPRERLRQYVTRLEEQLRGRSVQLDAVVPFGAGFLFWCAEPTGPARQLLQTAHELAVTLAEGHLDPLANAAIVTQTAQAFQDDPVLVGNARAYGYALVRGHYLPHITLGFDPRLAPRPAGGASAVSHPHTMTVDGVVLAAPGRLGRVETVFSLQ